MGFRKPETHYKLTFEKYDGFEVTVKSLSVGDLLDMSAIAKIDLTDPAMATEQSTKLLETFASHLVSWNLETEDGKTVPANLKGIRSQDMEFVMEIISEWMSQASKVNENLGSRQSTMPNLASLTTETLSHQQK